MVCRSTVPSGTHQYSIPFILLEHKACRREGGGKWKEFRWVVRNRSWFCDQPLQRYCVTQRTVGLRQNQSRSPVIWTGPAEWGGRRRDGLAGIEQHSTRHQSLAQWLLMSCTPTLVGWGPNKLPVLVRTGNVWHTRPGYANLKVLKQTTLYSLASRWNHIQTSHLGP